eukprot:SAG31_NODE_2928_length_4900_cov_6.506561_5_plen_34_part_00
MPEEVGQSQGDEREETSFCDYTPLMFGSAAGGH